MTEIEKKVVLNTEEEGVTFICLSFCDVYGNAKNVTIMPGELERAFESGIPLDASEIEGFRTREKIDLLLRPDAETYSDLPESLTHQAGNRIKRMFCHIYNPDGTRFEHDGRAILEQAAALAKEKGFSFNFGPAMEFYLFRTAENGNRLPLDQAGYMDSFPDDRCEEIRRLVCLELEKMNIQPECAYHEEGPGQNKIKFHFSDPVKAADSVIAYKSLVRTIADDHQTIADFSPKPLEREQGNSMHVNMSVMSEDGEDRTPHIIAGILNKVPEMTLFFNPVKKSYKRLGHDNAPKYISWSDANRSTLIRIPAYGSYTRFELRSPDCFSNPYLVFALLIHACLYGIEKEPVLQKATEIDLFTADPKSLPKLKTLPLTLSEAQGIAKKSDFIRSVLPGRIIDAYMKDRT